jgi:uncharacterized membrane protein HdeD (DUF308 family)
VILTERQNRVVEENTMSEVTDFVDAVIDEVRKSWGWFLVTGIVFIILGVLCIGEAQIATTLSILTLGWILLIGAALWLACALYTFVYGIAQYLPNPIIRGVIGYLLITHPNVGAEGVAILLATLFIVLGLFRATTASVYKFPRWKWAVFAGLVSFCLGVYLLSTWHTASTYLFGLLIGLDLIVDGTALVGFASAIHGSPAVQRKAA